MPPLFLELLQVALGNRDVLSRIPEREGWPLLLAEAKKQAVVGLMLGSIERLPSAQRPPKEELLRWIGMGQIEAETYSLQCARAKELIRLFNSVEFGAKSCVLKGVGMAQLYPVPERRHGGDIDLWVDGNRKEIMKWLQQHCEIGHEEWHHAEAKLFGDISVEVHFHPAWLYNPFYNRRLQRWFDEQKSEQMRLVDERLGFAYPTVRFNAVYALVHLYHHLLEEGIGIRHVVDYHYILKSLPTEEKVSVIADLKRFGMMSLAKAMMWVLQKVCRTPKDYLLCEPDEKEGLFLLDEIMRGGNFGHYRRDKRRRNSINRMFAMLPHYPQEVLWMVPWKCWHKCWRLLNA